MKALGLVVSDKKIFENCILKTYFLTLWPTYATNCKGLNNFDRGPPRDHSCKVWSKSNKLFQRRCCLKKLLTDGRTDARTDDGQRTPDIEGSQKLTEHFVLRWAKNLTSFLFELEIASRALWERNYQYLEHLTARARHTTCESPSWRFTNNVSQSLFFITHCFVFIMCPSVCQFCQAFFHVMKSHMKKPPMLQTR